VVSEDNSLSFFNSLKRCDKIHHVHINLLGVSIHYYNVLMPKKRTSKIKMNPGPWLWGTIPRGAEELELVKVMIL